MKDGRITDVQISASSQKVGNPLPYYSAKYARLDLLLAAAPIDLFGKHCGCWAALSNDVNQWIEVNFGVDSRSVTGVILQGRDNNSIQYVVLISESRNIRLAIATPGLLIGGMCKI